MADYFSNRRSLEPVDREVLIDRAKNGRLILLDVRPEVEFRSGHLPYAQSIPLRQLQSQFENLPRDREIVAYCRGPYCVLAQEAVNLLRAAGFQAISIEDGVAEWRLAGLEVAASDSPFPEHNTST